MRVPSNFINLGKCHHISPGSLTSWESYLGPIPIIHPTSNSTSAAVTALVKAFPVACTITSVAGQPLVSKVRCRLTLFYRIPELVRMWLNNVEHVPWNIIWVCSWQAKLLQGLNSIPVWSVCLKIGEPSFITSFPIQRAIFMGKPPKFQTHSLFQGPEAPS